MLGQRWTGGRSDAASELAVLRSYIDILYAAQPQGVPGGELVDRGCRRGWDVLLAGFP